MDSVLWSASDRLNFAASSVSVPDRLLRVPVLVECFPNWFALWGASEWMTLLGLIATVGGLGLALWALKQTKDLAKEAATDARRILDNELSAQLEFAPDRWGPVILHSIHDVPEGQTGFAASLRNVGRYPARDVTGSIWYGNQRIEAMPLPTMLPANAEPHMFQFDLPIARGGEGPYQPLRFHVTFRDGTPESKQLDACYVLSRDHPKVIWNSRPCGETTQKGATEAAP